MTRGRLQYWVDGYNVLFGWRLGEGNSLEERRDELVARCAALGVPVWMVFDSKEEGAGSAVRGVGRVRVRYAPEGLTADDVLSERVRDARNLGGVVVVTGDRELAARCRTLGARVMGLAEFERRVRPQAGPQKGHDRRPSGPLSPAQVEEWMRWFGKGRGPPPDAG